ncbi:hypothetical protein KCP70_13725 [Salmonella enterica subsp. enterica]|nr:hypothetical protein KCP70_13725 [Salmonella enterica subsp. enterica]
MFKVTHMVMRYAPVGVFCADRRHGGEFLVSCRRGRWRNRCCWYTCHYLFCAGGAGHVARLCVKYLDSGFAFER